MNSILLVMVIVAGLLANLVWTIYLLRRNNRARRRFSPSDMSDLDTRVEHFLTEIHRVTSANVELLESRIEALREVGVLADERLKRIRASLTELEVLLNRLNRVKTSWVGRNVREVDEDDVIQFPLSTAAESPLPPPPQIAAGRSETVWGLHRQGLTERQIAQKVGLGIAEVRFLLKLSNAGGKSPVESK